MFCISSPGNNKYCPSMPTLWKWKFHYSCFKLENTTVNSRKVRKGFLTNPVWFFSADCTEPMKYWTVQIWGNILVAFFYGKTAFVELTVLQNTGLKANLAVVIIIKQINCDGKLYWDIFFILTWCVWVVGLGKIQIKKMKTPIRPELDLKISKIVEPNRTSNSSF